MRGARPARPWDVIVIGAGASGLHCAATCGARGRSVLLLEHGPRAGAKVAVSGGGRCNFTNREISADHYRSDNPHFCRSALARFGPEDAIAMLESRGIPWRERSAGQLFCETDARRVVELLLARCAGAGVELRLGCAVGAVGQAPGAGFTVETPDGPCRGSALVVATGGLSYPRLGASGLGFEIARRFGLGVVAPRPALTPLLFPRERRQRLAALAGVSVEATLACAGRRHTGSLLFTHRGLSGPVALQASLRWSPGETLRIDLAPGADLLAALRARRGSAATTLGRHVPKRVVATLLAGHPADRPLAALADAELPAMAAALQAWELLPEGTAGYAVAEVTAGGVDTAELSSKTMEARRVPGLHFVGEVVDVTGELGGYNLHWAFASALAAGSSL